MGRTEYAAAMRAHMLDDISPTKFAVIDKLRPFVLDANANIIVMSPIDIAFAFLLSVCRLVNRNVYIAEQSEPVRDAIANIRIPNCTIYPYTPVEYVYTDVEFERDSASADVVYINAKYAMSQLYTVLLRTFAALNQSPLKKSKTVILNTLNDLGDALSLADIIRGIPAKTLYEIVIGNNYEDLYDDDELNEIYRQLSGGSGTTERNFVGGAIGDDEVYNISSARPAGIIAKTIVHFNGNRYKVNVGTQKGIAGSQKTKSPPGWQGELAIIAGGKSRDESRNIKRYTPGNNVHDYGLIVSFDRDTVTIDSRMYGEEKKYSIERAVILNRVEEEYPTLTPYPELSTIDAPIKLPSSFAPKRKRGTAEIVSPIVPPDFSDIPPDEDTDIHNDEELAAAKKKVEEWDVSSLAMTDEERAAMQITHDLHRDSIAKYESTPKKKLFDAGVDDFAKHKDTISRLFDTDVATSSTAIPKSETIPGVAAKETDTDPEDATATATAALIDEQNFANKIKRIVNELRAAFKITGMRKFDTYKESDVMNYTYAIKL